MAPQIFIEDFEQTNFFEQSGNFVQGTATPNTDEGPYLASLFTDGGEYWSSTVVNSIPPQTSPSPAFLTEANSYTGWYHIRNFGLPDEMAVPTKYYDATDTSGEIIYDKESWFRAIGLDEVADQISIQNETSDYTGCTNPTAVNYNPNATTDDGSCLFIPGWLMGEIPPNTINDLYTEGGELTNTAEQDYQGWYHIHGATGLPSGVIAGTIMMGRKYWWESKPAGQPDNNVLMPYGVDRLIYLSGIDYEKIEEELRDILWNDIVLSESDSTPGLENQNTQPINDSLYRITLQEDTEEILIINNNTSIISPASIMEDIEYEFTELIPDVKKFPIAKYPNGSAHLSPGIFGTKPLLNTDLDSLELNEPG